MSIEADLFFKKLIKNFIKNSIERLSITFKNHLSRKYIWPENTDYLVIALPNGENALISIDNIIDHIYLNMFTKLMIDIEFQYNIESKLFILAIFNYYHLTNSDNIKQLFSIDNKDLYEKCIFEQEEYIPNSEAIDFFYMQIDKCNKDVKAYIFNKFFFEDVFMNMVK